MKGSTTADKLAPPPVNPADLSRGYGLKAPGQADRSAPTKWEVASYMFNNLVLLAANVVYATSYVATRLTLAAVPPATVALSSGWPSAAWSLSSGPSRGSRRVLGVLDGRPVTMGIEIDK